MPEPGDVVLGVGTMIRCGDCSGAGWVMHESAPGVRQKCPRCNGTCVLLDDGVSEET